MTLSNDYFKYDSGLGRKVKCTFGRRLKVSASTDIMVRTIHAHNMWHLIDLVLIH